MQKQKKWTRKAFTLVELIIVIVVIGLLAGLAVPKFIGVAKDADLATLLRDIDTLEKVIPVYHIDHDDYPVFDPPLTIENDQLKEFLLDNGESLDNLHKVNLEQTKPYHSKLKHGYEKDAKDYFIYSKDSGRVYYAKGIVNGEGKTVYGNNTISNENEEMSSVVKNVKLGDTPLKRNKSVSVSETNLPLTGSIPVEEEVQISVNGDNLPVSYENITDSDKDFKSNVSLSDKKTNEIIIETSNEELKYQVIVKTDNKQEDNKPIAVISFSMDKGFTTASTIEWKYDNSIAKNGTVIVDAEWQGAQTNYPVEGEYTVKLRVKDSNGNWSDWVEKTFTVRNATGIKDITSGDYHNFALYNDGTVKAWGSGTMGQLGNNSKDEVLTATTNSRLKNVKQIVASAFHTVVLLEDGTVWGMGYNSGGQLGSDAAPIQQLTPIQIKSLSNVKQIASEYACSYALLENGTIWQIGNGNNIPIQIQNLSNVKQIEGGENHCLALLEDGTVWAWGSNTDGQLGNGTNDTSSTPVQVTNLSNVKQVVAGYKYSLALLEDGTVWGWGDNYYGQLGNGSKEDSNIPVRVRDLTNVKQIATGNYHSLAVLEDGTLYGWGENNQGQLGFEAEIQVTTPRKFKNITNVEKVSGGLGHTIILQGNNTLKACGLGMWGQCGDGLKTYKNKSLVTVKGI